MNLMGRNLTAQVRTVSDLTTAVATGDPSRKIIVDIKGDKILELKDTINAMVDQLERNANLDDKHRLKGWQEPGHSGHISARSKIKEGTVFTVSLPQTYAPANQLAESSRQMQRFLPHHTLPGISIYLPGRL